MVPPPPSSRRSGPPRRWTGVVGLGCAVRCGAERRCAPSRAESSRRCSSIMSILSPKCSLAGFAVSRDSGIVPRAGDGGQEADPELFLLRATARRSSPSLRSLSASAPAAAPRATAWSVSLASLPASARSAMAGAAEAAPARSISATKGGAYPATSTSDQCCTQPSRLPRLCILASHARLTMGTSCAWHPTTRVARSQTGGCDPP